MKTNFYILLIFLLVFSFGNAQSTSEVVKVETIKTVEVSEVSKQPIIESPIVLNENQAVMVDVSQVKALIARSNSDIRLYFNRLRNVDNLDMLFPKIHKTLKA